MPRSYDPVGDLIFATRAFSAAHYSAAPANAWDVTAPSVETARYAIINNVLYMQLSVTNTDITGTPSTIRMTIPESRTAKGVTYNAALGDAGNGYYEPLYALTNVGEVYVNFSRVGGVAWSAGGGVAVAGTFIIELTPI